MVPLSPPSFPHHFFSTPTLHSLNAINQFLFYSHYSLSCLSPSLSRSPGHTCCVCQKGFAAVAPFTSLSPLPISLFLSSVRLAHLKICCLSFLMKRAVNCCYCCCKQIVLGCAARREEERGGGVKLPVALIFRNKFHLKWKNGKQIGEGQKTH